jgi:hypothetical protein
MSWWERREHLYLVLNLVVSSSMLSMHDPRLS